MRAKLAALAQAVAPRAGAWIETPTLAMLGEAGKSHPVRVRGLKHFGAYELFHRQSRTPCGCVD
ncbi:exported hypothetical protein [Syntrophaceticus schinkii]|uniref:Uncharacterized protein n=1 Tax=Syntrophaceticus schinkii TaxID=499207 RepID=A0A0B7MDU3_9FIRM|nr:exported hypothetical protein [Syntrophaceticus schinkii]